MCFLFVAFAEEEGSRGAQKGAGEEVGREEEGHRTEGRRAQEPGQLEYRYVHGASAEVTLGKSAAFPPVCVPLRLMTREPHETGKAQLLNDGDLPTC